MGTLRTFITSHSASIALLLACVLALKLLIPTGYMPAPGQLAIQLCTGEDVRTVLIDRDGQRIPDGQPHQASAAMPCAYAGLVAPLLSATPPALLVVAILFMLATGIRLASVPTRQRAVPPRPPGRAPPLTILT
ncbi:hypothetical protein [Sphingomonas sp. AX6]|uniref:hypothetical protein n=1 Tax=Sphingomonas sp. AX6 TaxID=2653171 RepID=UPI0012F2D281|nr:hypothetical protein [Sphingomonas sp. AX6]VXC86093.1 conserved hypothetical protein [Sphingomonas sp. AX6]